VHSKISVFVFVIMTFAVLSVVAQQNIPKDLVINLNRSACFGWCLAYSLTITGDGNFTITPAKRSVREQQSVVPITGKISLEKLTRLLAEFRNIRFFSLKRRYGSAAKLEEGRNCPRIWTDSPTVVITISANGEQKTVSHYTGCEGAQILSDLEGLEDKIDEAVGTKQWEPQLRTGIADVIDLQIEVHPTKSSTQSKSH
jgi:hypothetical protein